MEKKLKPKNHHKPYTAEELKQLEEIAKECKTKTIMHMIVQERKLSEKFGRTEVSICKKIEDINGFYWVQNYESKF